MLSERLAEAQQDKEEVAAELASVREATALSATQPLGEVSPTKGCLTGGPMGEVSMSKSSRRRAKRRTKALEQENASAASGHSSGSARLLSQSTLSSPVVALHQLLACGSLEARFGPQRIALALEQLGQQLGSTAEGLARVTAGASSDSAEVESLSKERQEEPIILPGKYCLSLIKDSLANLGLRLNLNPEQPEGYGDSPELERAVVRGRLLELLEDLVWKPMCEQRTSIISDGSVSSAAAGQQPALTALSADTRVVEVCEAVLRITATDWCRQAFTSRLLEDTCVSGSDTVPGLGGSCVSESAGENASSSKPPDRRHQQQPLTDERLKVWIQQAGVGVAKGVGLGRPERVRDKDSVALIHPKINRLILGLVRSALDLWVLVTAAHPMLVVSITRTGQSLPRDGRAAYTIKEVKGSSLQQGLYSSSVSSQGRGCQGGSHQGGPPPVVLCSQIPGVRFRSLENGLTDVERTLIPEALVTLKL